MDIIWSRAADRDVAQIFGFLEPRNMRVARSFLKRLFNAVDALAEIPRMGSPAELGLENEYRALVLDHYKIFYSIETDRLIIARIWDTRRDPTTFFIR